MYKCAQFFQQIIPKILVKKLQKCKGGVGEINDQKDLSQIDKDYRKVRQFWQHISTSKGSTFPAATPFLLSNSQIPCPRRAPGQLQHEKEQVFSPGLLEKATWYTKFKAGLLDSK